MDDVAAVREILDGPIEEAPTVEDAPVEDVSDEIIEPTDEEVTETVAEDAGPEIEEAEWDNDDFNVKDLAGQIEMEPEDLYKMKISLSDDADPVELGSIKDAFQDISRDKIELQKQLDDQQLLVDNANNSMQLNQQASNEMVQAQANMQNISNLYNNEAYWQELRDVEGDGHVALKKQELMQQYNQAEARIGQINQHQQQQQQQFMQQATEKMYTVLPEWKDNAVKRNDQDMIRTSLIGNGFSENDIQGIVDPRLLVMARKLARYEQAEVKSKDTLASVRKAPKILRGKGGRFKAKKTERVDNIVAKAKSSGKKGDEVAAVKALLGWDK